MQASLPSLQVALLVHGPHRPVGPGPSCGGAPALGRAPEPPAPPLPPLPLAPAAPVASLLTAMMGSPERSPHACRPRQLRLPRTTQHRNMGLRYTAEWAEIPDSGLE